MGRSTRLTAIMAENENSQEKSEQPTPKRLREAREKGQVANSRELNTTLVLLGGSGCVAGDGRPHARRSSRS
jgi:flagellar biosynthesis protein FlhB